MELLFALYKPKEFDYTLHRHFHVIGILSVCDIKCYNTALYFVDAGREVHRVCTHKEGSFCELAHGRSGPFELTFRE
jgi:hypothetical protein